MRVAFCASEAVPFAKTGGLGDVVGTLPPELEKLGIDVVLFLPKYKAIDAKKIPLKKISDRVSQGIIGKNIKVFFIEHKDYFDRDGLYGTTHGDYLDNLDRFHYYSIQVFEILKELEIPVDILHCHDWQAALIPVYLKERYRSLPFFNKTKSVLTIHNLAYQGTFKREEFAKLGLKHDLFGLEGFEFYGKGNLLKAGIIFSDSVTTVSRQYSKEILTREYGCGLEGVLKQHPEKVVGILNGIDYSAWNPQSDTFIEKQYTLNDYKEGKKINKAKLQNDFHLPVKEDVPVFGFVGRLSHQKGIDLIFDAMKELGQFDVQMIFLGEGEQKYSHLLKDIHHRFPRKVAYTTTFNEKLAHQIYAGSDLLLMPSCYEPCGLSQMIALAYGTIPVVYYTGGLADTIIPHDAHNLLGNGFVFRDYKVKAFVDMIKRSLEIYHQPNQFDGLIRNGFISDFSWRKSAVEYRDHYQWLLSA